MIYYPRKLKSVIANSSIPGKVSVLLGACRAGKNVLVQHLISTRTDESLVLNGDDMGTVHLLQNRTVENYRRLLGRHTLLIID